MRETLALIEQIIEEHKTILQRLATLDQVANDAEALRGLDQAQKSFMPGRLDEHKGLQRLVELFELIDQGLQAHFSREETALRAAFEEQGDRDLVSAFDDLLLEHKDLRNRLVNTRNYISQLTGGGLSRHRWESTAHDMRAHISHTRRLLEAHAELEQDLLFSLRRRLLGAEKV